ncbi:unnamed protein product [Orchesella dallaii]|uniref:Uncharacterized protein n=1 Tax=Orchesella dallaii TaxID=48710 RepID=A0ABP1QXM0_9HEXA
MLTEEQICAFKIHHLFLWYYPRLPFTWNKEYTQFIVTKSRIHWAIWLTCLVDTLFVALANIYITWTHFYWKPRKYFEFTHVFIFIAGGSFVLTVCFVVGIVIYYFSDVIEGYNGFYTLNCRMTRRFRPEDFNSKGEFNNGGLPDNSGLLGCAVSFCLSSTPALVVIIVCLGNYDIITFLAHEFLPPAEYWSLTTLHLLHLLRFVIVGISLIEVVRCLNYYLLMVGTALIGVIECVHYYQHLIEDDEEFLWWYNQLAVVYKHLEKAVVSLITLLISVAFWGTVAAIWIVIRGYGKMEPVIYGLLVGGVGVTIVITVFTVRQAKFGVLVLDGILKERVVKAEVVYKERKTRKAKRIAKSIKALRPVTFWFGNFTPLTMGFAVEYCKNLVERVVDLVMLFDLTHV